MDLDKHESYKAASIMYKAESKQASDNFNGACQIGARNDAARCSRRVSRV